MSGGGQRIFLLTAKNLPFHSRSLLFRHCRFYFPFSVDIMSFLPRISSFISRLPYRQNFKPISTPSATTLTSSRTMASQAAEDISKASKEEGDNTKGETSNLDS